MDAIEMTLWKLWDDPEKAAFLNGASYAHQSVTALVSLKSGCVDVGATQAEIDEVYDKVYPMMPPSAVHRLSEGAPWLGEKGLAYLKELHEEKFGYIDGLLERLPEDARGVAKDGIWEVLNASYDFTYFAALKLLYVRYSKRLGALAVFDSTEDYGDVALCGMMKSALNGFEIRCAIEGSRGVGVRVVKGTGDFKVPIGEITSSIDWKVGSGIEGSLPLPMGESESGIRFVVDLAKLNGLVVFSSDLGGMTDFVSPVLVGLIRARTPQQVKVVTVDGSNWALDRLVDGRSVRSDYVIGSASPGVSDFSGDAAKVEVWCRHAESQIALVRNEIESRRRLLSATGCESAAQFRSKVKTDLPDWICCIAALPTKLNLSDPWYKTYCDVQSKVWDLMYEDIADLGIHFVYLTYAHPDPDTSLLLHTRLNEGGRVGAAVVYGNFDIADSFSMIGTGDAVRVGGGRCVYRTPVGEIVDYCTSVD